MPITPIVSKIACGFNNDTEAENRICCFGRMIEYEVSALGLVLLDQIDQPIYNKNSTPAPIKNSFTVLKVSMIADMPATASKIKIVSQIIAVIMAGRLLQKEGC